MKKGVLGLISLFIIVALAGCGLNTAKIGQEDYISKEKTSYVVIDPQKEVDDRTDWDVVDSIMLNKVEPNYKITYLKESHPEVQAVKKITEAFLSAELNINYETYTGQEGAPFFTQRKIDADKKNNMSEQKKEDVVNNKLVVQMTGVKNYSGIYFNKNFTKCRVEVLPTIRFVSAKEGALGEGVELNKDYFQITTVWLQKENDVWKVFEFDFAGLKPIK